jgi:hypothetical protein
VFCVDEKQAVRLRVEEKAGYEPAFSLFFFNAHSFTRASSRRTPESSL